MKITLIQPDIRWEDKNGNLKNLQKLLRNVPSDTSIIILPEMFNTGFSMNAPGMAEDWKSETFNWMNRISDKYHAALCGSYIVREEGHYFNRFTLVSRGDDPVKYDKRHLFSIGGEDKQFTMGNSRAIFRLNEFRINPSICYDLRFPVWLRNRNDYDLLICVANWPDSRREVWKTLLTARAIENQCYVAGVNRVGEDYAGSRYAGDSMIIDPKGTIIAALPEYEQGIVSAEMSITYLQNFRKKFPVWKDSDDFEIL